MHRVFGTSHRYHVVTPLGQPRLVQVFVAPASRRGVKTLILGLDINTRKTGFSVLDESGRSVDCGILSTDKEEGVFHKSFSIREQLIQLRDRVEARLRSEWVTGVEEFLPTATGGHIYNIITLAQFNTLVSYECNNVFGLLPARLSAYTMRKHFGIPTRAKDKTVKNEIKKAVFDYISQNVLTEYPWKRTKEGNIHMSNFDVTDAALVSSYTLFLWQTGTIYQTDDNKKVKGKSATQIPIKEEAKEEAEEIAQEKEKAKEGPPRKERRRQPSKSL
ncbi:hypothetical protein PROFUN_05185 [Planoprotostelium fungivorum]|uniref:Uncharacterized protein n=1 Tax=Planoprotostelium fungivorum TaxID=1890364 RepID=A0A2P6NRH0_9EUKA|nr:hypothetical protein PROFUN_05185 [Planoprotostelium fungivorum]